MVCKFIMICGVFFLVILLGIVSGQFSLYIVIGDSMDPVFVDNDLLMTVNENNQKFIIGDIIAFRPQHGEEWQGPTIAHRIVAIDEAGHITTKGDNVGFADPYDIYPADVIGRVVLVLPGAGAVMRVATSFYGYLALVLVPSLWLIINELRHLRGWRARP